ncbi:hypothetical protein BIW11_09222 [Tropilaelaps mercedesae]|uniref:Uncharacterized protein n=1 Tax=Tropilaelaps mercedesae TaxID=418985 RepID=A0A1V9XLI9_9ACAR|nr:hypothetical protein BIW11_09222 [Tropilaelaps mercedesae]
MKVCEAQWLQISSATSMCLFVVVPSRFVEVGLFGREKGFRLTFLDASVWMDGLSIRPPLNPSGLVLGVMRVPVPDDEAVATRVNREPQTS